jgi:Xaa-Pro dipeptidase
MPKDTLELPDRHQLLLERHAHVRSAMRKADVPAVLELDSNHIVYATGASNMQLFTLRTPARYLLILADGPTILYEYVGCEHLAKDLPTIDDIRPSEGLDTISSGGDVAASARRFAAEIAGAIRDHDPEIDRIAIGRFPWRAVDALRAEGLTVTDADAALLPARAIKLDIELPFIREAMRRVEQGVRRLEDTAAPDRTEAETWAEFHYSLMAKEGQYVSTRLFQSGPNTYPYFQEAGGRVLQAGDLLCLDTDAVGFENYAVDFSRTFLCGQDKATDDQRLLYARAREQLETNADLLQPGRSFEEIARKAWKVPEEHLASRYYCVGHGLGMSGEFPNIPHHIEGQPYPLPGHLEPGMIICLESYVGWDRSHEGVKLENQYLITETGVECMSAYPFDDRLSGRMI